MKVTRFAMLAMLVVCCTQSAAAGPTSTIHSTFVRLTDGPARPRAVVLINGYEPHVRTDSVRRARLAKWQAADSAIGKALSKRADLYAFAFSQDVPVEMIAGAANQDGRDLGSYLATLSHDEVVLVAHSAGGLVARHFVEDHPKSRVTKVVQVCTPNAGTSLGMLKFAVREAQEPFTRSLTREHRATLPKRRIPEHLQFVVLLANGFGSGDGVVSGSSAWPVDLRRQRIGVRTVRARHANCVLGDDAITIIEELVDEPQPRWPPKRVTQTVRDLFGS